MLRLITMTNKALKNSLLNPLSISGRRALCVVRSQFEGVKGITVRNTSTIGESDVNNVGGLILPSRQFLTCLLISLFLFIALTSSAHVIPYDLKKITRTDIALIYLKLGFTHIIPNGFDHILFVVGLFLLNPKLKVVITQATAFTIAHSITLGLAMSGHITPLPSIVEPVIALSIMFVAIENILIKELKPWRILIVFFFGLIHGLGFASALSEIGLAKHDFFTSVIMFNLGVELGQITVILFMYWAVARWFQHKTWYHSRIVVPLSAAIAAIAFYWTIQRVFYT
jgi:hypothetical protein